jgi:hypothetical protein
MTPQRDAQGPVAEQWEREDQIVALEDRLHRRRVMRFAAPASFLMFAALVLVMLGDAFPGQRPGSASFVWSVLFVVGYLLALVWNEASARRSLPILNDELMALRALAEESSTDYV